MKPSQLSATDYLPYYKTYVSLNDEAPLLQLLADGMEKIPAFFEGIPKDKQAYSYQVGKWTPKEVLLHIIDTERVFAYRALAFARNKGEVLPGFDQDVYVANSDANAFEFEVLISMYVATRTATIFVFKGLSDAVLRQKGIASGAALSVAAAGFIICGHETHHCNIIQERYLKSL